MTPDEPKASAPERTAVEKLVVDWRDRAERQHGRAAEEHRLGQSMTAQRFSSSAIALSACADELEAALKREAPPAPEGLSVGDIIPLDKDRRVRVEGMSDGQICRNYMGNVATRNLATGRLSYIKEARLLAAKHFATGADAFIESLSEAPPAPTCETCRELRTWLVDEWKFADKQGWSERRDTLEDVSKHIESVARGEDRT